MLSQIVKILFCVTVLVSVPHNYAEVPNEVVTSTPAVVQEDTVEYIPEDIHEEVVEESATSIEESVVYKGVLTPSGLTASELELGLLYDLKDYSEFFIQAEKETGINAVFLSAVAALESGWAKSNVSRVYNNLFGWTYSTGYAKFDSKQECILFVAGKIKDLYLTEDGIYFSGYEVSDVNVYYNGSQQWEDNVNLIMKQISTRIERASKEDTYVEQND